MTEPAAITIRLVTEPGPIGFWPRENYFEGGADNGYALVVRPQRPLALSPGATLRLHVPTHVPHLPYRFDGAATTLEPGRDTVLLFPWGGRTRVLDDAQVERFVQHAFDPSGVSETTDPDGNPVRQQGRRAAPILYRGEIEPA